MEAEDVGAALAWAALVGLALAAYLLGTVPFGLLLVKRFAHRDVRNEGSGNIGATNVLRVAGRGLGAATLALDALKGALPVLAARGLGLATTAAALLGLMAFLGHCFPVYLRFRGGKGVATALGVVAALHPAVAAVAVAVFALCFAATRVVSVSSLAGTAAVGVAAVASRAGGVMLALYGVLAAVVVIRHATNLRRLARGAEPKV